MPLNKSTKFSTLFATASMGIFHNYDYESSKINEFLKTITDFGHSLERGRIEGVSDINRKIIAENIKQIRDIMKNSGIEQESYVNSPSMDFFTTGLMDDSLIEDEYEVYEP